MSKIGIIGAMELEIETLKEKMNIINTVNKANMSFFEGTLNGTDIVLVKCGIGKVNAGICTQILVDLFEVTHIINTGVAGSLCAELDIGDFVISEKAMYHDFDCSSLNPDYPVGKVPGLSVHAFEADPEMIRLAYDAAQQVHADHARKGTVASGDQFVSSKTQKAKIVADTGAICTEMEGTAIAHAAWRNGVPFVVIRAISDKADDSAQMDYPTFEAIAAKRCAAVTQLLAKNMA